MLYKFVFVAALTHRYVTFFNNSLHDLVVNFMTPILVRLNARLGFVVALLHRHVRASLAHRYVTFFTNSLHDLVANFITPILVRLKARLGYPGLLGVFYARPHAHAE